MKNNVKTGFVFVKNRYKNFLSPNIDPSLKLNQI